MMFYSCNRFMCARFYLIYTQALLYLGVMFSSTFFLIICLIFVLKHGRLLSDCPLSLGGIHTFIQHANEVACTAERPEESLIA